MLSFYVVITGIERQACYQMRGTVENSIETIFYIKSEFMNLLRSVKWDYICLYMELDWFIIVNYMLLFSVKKTHENVSKYMWICFLLLKFGRRKTTMVRQLSQGISQNRRFVINPQLTAMVL